MKSKSGSINQQLKSVLSLFRNKTWTSLMQSELLSTLPTINSEDDMDFILIMSIFLKVPECMNAVFDIHSSKFDSPQGPLEKIFKPPVICKFFHTLDSIKKEYQDLFAKATDAFAYEIPSEFIPSVISEIPCSILTSDLIFCFSLRNSDALTYAIETAPKSKESAAALQNFLVCASSPRVSDKALSDITLLLLEGTFPLSSRLFQALYFYVTRTIYQLPPIMYTSLISASEILLYTLSQKIPTFQDYVSSKILDFSKTSKLPFFSMKFILPKLKFLDVKSLYSTFIEFGSSLKVPGLLLVVNNPSQSFQRIYDIVVSKLFLTSNIEVKNIHSFSILFSHLTSILYPYDVFLKIVSNIQISPKLLRSLQKLSEEAKALLKFSSALSHPSDASHFISYSNHHFSEALEAVFIFCQSNFCKSVENQSFLTSFCDRVFQSIQITQIEAHNDSSPRLLKLQNSQPTTKTLIEEIRLCAKKQEPLRKIESSEFQNLLSAIDEPTDVAKPPTMKVQDIIQKAIVAQQPKRSESKAKKAQEPDSDPYLSAPDDSDFSDNSSDKEVSTSDGSQDLEDPECINFAEKFKPSERH